LSVQPSALSIALVADPTEPHIVGMTRFFLEQGHDIRVLVPTGVAERMTTCAGAPIIRLPPPDPHLPAMVRYVIAVRAARRLARWADVVHGHSLYPYGWIAAATGRPLVVTVWGSDVYRSLHRSAKDRVGGWLTLRRAGVVTADSTDLAAAAIRGGARAARTHVMQFGVELHAFQPGAPDAQLRSRLGLDGRRVIFSARSPTPLYRHEIAVAALRELPDDVVLLMSSHRAVPGYLEELQAQAERLGVADRLRLVPDIEHERMPEYLRLADVVVSIPESDATPLTILEAMACGRPVVAGALPSIREWADGLDPELLLDEPDPASLAHGIRLALDRSASDVMALASRGRKVVSERADRRENMLGMVGLYRQLVRRRIPWSTTGASE
jgi:glycosyltransferase involved in cell wall biosynthesis